MMLIISINTYLTSFLFSVKGIGKQAPKKTTVRVVFWFAMVLILSFTKVLLSGYFSQ